MQIYEKYKKKYYKKQNGIFFEEHKHEKWFTEKYHPTESKLIKQELLKNRREINYKRFMERFNAGEFNDINLEISQEEFTKLKEK